MNEIPLPVLVSTTVVATALYFWIMERQTYRASWRVHISGIGLPVMLMMASRHPVVWTIAIAFITVHVASVLSETVFSPE